MKVDMVAPGPNSMSIGEVEVPLDPRMPKDKKQGVLVEDLVSVSIYNDDPTKMVKFDSNFPDQHREQLLIF